MTTRDPRHILGCMLKRVEQYINNLSEFHPIFLEHNEYLYVMSLNMQPLLFSACARRRYPPHTQHHSKHICFITFRGLQFGSAHHRLQTCHLQLHHSLIVSQISTNKAGITPFVRQLDTENSQAHAAIGEAHLRAPLVSKLLVPILVLAIPVAMHEGCELVPKPRHLHVLCALLREQTALQHHVLPHSNGHRVRGALHAEWGWEESKKSL